MIWSMAYLENGEQFHWDQCQKKQELVSSGESLQIKNQLHTLFIISLQSFLSNVQNFYVLKILLNLFEILN
jgi:hypothetical protein